MLFAPGTEGTVSSTTLEDRTVQLLFRCQTVDLNNYITATLDTDTGFLKGTIEIPGKFATDTNGFPEMRFSNIFPYTGFNTGLASGGASKASNISEAVAEALQLLAIAERTVKNTGTLLYIESYSIALLSVEQNNINASLLVDFDLPCEITIQNGKTVINGKTYLED